MLLLKDIAITSSSSSSSSCSSASSSSSFIHNDIFIYMYNMHRTLLYNFLGKVLSWLSPGEEADVFKLVADIGLETRNLDALEIRRGKWPRHYTVEVFDFLYQMIGTLLYWDMLGWLAWLGYVRMIFPFQPYSHVWSHAFEISGRHFRPSNASREAPTTKWHPSPGAWSESSRWAWHSQAGGPQLQEFIQGFWDQTQITKLPLASTNSWCTWSMLMSWWWVDASWLRRSQVGRFGWTD